VREAFERVHFESIIETGTYRGTTTAFLRGISSAPIATIEADSRYYNYSRFRFVGRGVTVMSGDSAQMLERLAAGDPWRRSPAFFYLDAHWLAALPLPREIATITRQWSDYVVVVDDFRVPDDAGYGFDDYGEAGALAVEILAPIATPRTIVYWPNARSDAETGARRGWVMLVSAGSIDERLRSMTAIRRAGELTAVADRRPCDSLPFLNDVNRSSDYVGDVNLAARRLAERSNLQSRLQEDSGADWGVTGVFGVGRNTEDRSLAIVSE
jgi:hypothetical protein